MAGIEYSLAHDSREYLFRSVPLEAWDALHKTFAVFQRYNNPTEEDLREVVTAPLQTSQKTRQETRQSATVVKLLSNDRSSA